MLYEVITSLDLELIEGDDYTLMDTLADERANQEELLLQHEEESQRTHQVRKAMEHLNDRERVITSYSIHYTKLYEGDQ